MTTNTSKSKVPVALLESEQTIDGPGGLRLVLDGGQCHPGNPRKGCPVSVELEGEDEDGEEIEGSVAYRQAIKEGEVEGIELTDGQVAWLLDLEGEVAAWLKHWNQEAEKEAAKLVVATGPTKEQVASYNREVEAWCQLRDKAESNFIGKHKRLPSNGEECIGLPPFPTMRF